MEPRTATVRCQIAPASARSMKISVRYRVSGNKLFLIIKISEKLQKKFFSKVFNQKLFQQSTSGGLQKKSFLRHDHFLRTKNFFLINRQKSEIFDHKKKFFFNQKTFLIKSVFLNRNPPDYKKKKKFISGRTVVALALRGADLQRWHHR